MKELNSINLTTKQKQVMAIIISAATPKAALGNIRGDLNLAVARDELLKLGVVQQDDDGLSLTDVGEQVAVDNNVADASGNLSDEAQALVNGDQQPQSSTNMDPVPGVGGGVEGDINALTMSNVPSWEQLELLRELLNN